MELMFGQMHALERLLQAEHIPYEYTLRDEALVGAQICMPSLDMWESGKGISAVIHAYSYGGRDGLIEIGWHRQRRVCVKGWLDAEEALGEIQKLMEAKDYDC